MDAFADYESDEGDQGEHSVGAVAAADNEEPVKKPANTDTKAEKLPAKRKLPSAASMLASGVSTPSFLHSKQDTTEIQEINVLEERKEAEAAKSAGTEPAPKKVAPTPAAPLAAGKTSQPAKQSVGRGKVDPKDKDVKDKVKQQRMRGQSAHERWKSEGEMLLRQQFD